MPQSVPCDAFLGCTCEPGRCGGRGPRARVVTTPLRYLLYQLPGAVIVGLLCWLAWRWGLLGAKLSVSLFLLWIVKDLFLYRYVYHAYESLQPPIGAEALIGLEGRSCEELQPGGPAGYVQVKGERWRARVLDERVGAGDTVLVCDVEEKELLVRGGAGAEDCE